jgi:hypothetical protein
MKSKKLPWYVTMIVCIVGIFVLLPLVLGFGVGVITYYIDKTNAVTKTNNERVLLEQNEQRLQQLQQEHQKAQDKENEDQSFLTLTSDGNVIFCTTLTKLSSTNPVGTVLQSATSFRQGVERGKLQVTTREIKNCNIDDKSHVSVGICNFYMPTGIRAYFIMYDLKSINGSKFDAKKGGKGMCEGVKGEWTDAENDWGLYNRARGNTQVM